MRTQPPTIFISATTADLIKAREVVTRALLDLGCHPVVQEHFGTSEGNIAAREAGKINDCDAVIHLVGKVYGASPVDEGSGRSYTQLEYDTAVRLQKPLYLFLATDQFFADPNNLPPGGLPAEAADRAQKQREHYLKLKAGDNIWFEFSSLADLRDKIMQLREKDKKWGQVLKTDRRHYLWIAAATFILLAAIGAGLFFTDKKNRLLAAQEHEKTRQLIAALDLTAKNPKEQPSDLRGAELYEWMLNKAASAEGISLDEAKARIAEFVVKVDTDKSASPRDRALVKIARKFVLQGFTPTEFAKYVKSLAFSDWHPKFFVLHHTASPTLAERPDGFSEAQLRNMVDFLTLKIGWNGGPHLFVDRNRIWVFNTLTEPGVHTRSWNKEAIGIEMLGNYDFEPFDDKVRDNAVSAIAALSEVLKIDGTQVRFHREHPGTSTNCPGKNVSKEEIIERVVRAVSGRQDS